MVPWMPKVFSLASGEERPSERVVLVGERPLAQAVKYFERSDPITLPFILPELRFDPGNLIGRLEKRFLKGLLLVKCAMILAKLVLHSQRKLLECLFSPLRHSPLRLRRSILSPQRENTLWHPGCPYGCICLFNKHYMKMRTRLPKVGM